LELCGFTLGDLPDESQFYRFLTETPNAILKQIHHPLNQRLIEQEFVTLDTFVIDSTPVMTATKENNFKNPIRNTTHKTQAPDRNPSATLSYYSCQVINGKKENTLFF
jgi:hypothetical protein